MNIPTLSYCASKNIEVEVLLWVGCAGAFDARYKRVMQTFTKLLEKAGVSFAILGEEESCTGDPAKRAGNEFLFQMQALTNIERLNTYGVRSIVTTCPHCLNTLRHEYPALGGNYKVQHHSELLAQLITQGRIKVKKDENTSITYHDPCYLGRGQGQYEAPRTILKALFAELREMKRCREKSMCCGAGGAQIFKESETGHTEIHHMRAQEALHTQTHTIASACPFCMLMLSDGVKHHAREEVKIQDLAELVALRIEDEEGDKVSPQKP